MRMSLNKNGSAYKPTPSKNTLHFPHKTLGVSCYFPSQKAFMATRHKSPSETMETKGYRGEFSLAIYVIPFQIFLPNS